MVRCSVLRCKSDSERRLPNIYFHSFPDDEDRREVWLKAIGRTNWTIKKSSRICSLHFSKEALLKKKKLTYLLPNAVPIMLTLSLQQSTPQSTPANDDSTSEHGYSGDEPSTSKQSIEATQSKSCLYTCHNCKQNIVDARFACVQCENYDVCMRCAASDVHEDHYLLRVPKHSTQGQTLVVLQAVRAQLKFLQPENIKQKTVIKVEDTIGESEEVLDLQVAIKNEPTEEDPLEQYIEVEYTPNVKAEAEYMVKFEPETDDVYDGEGDPKSKKARLSDDKCQLPSSTHQLEIEGCKQFAHHTSGAPSLVTNNNSYILKFKRRTVFTQWCKESGPLKQRRLNVLRTLHKRLPKSTPVDITMLESRVNNLCEKFEKYEQQTHHGDSSSILNKFSEWFDVEEVVIVSKA